MFQSEIPVLHLFHFCNRVGFFSAGVFIVVDCAARMQAFGCGPVGFHDIVGMHWISCITVPQHHQQDEWRCPHSSISALNHVRLKFGAAAALSQLLSDRRPPFPKAERFGRALGCNRCGQSRTSKVGIVRHSFYWTRCSNCSRGVQLRSDASSGCRGDFGPDLVED